MPFPILCLCCVLTPLPRESTAADGVGVDDQKIIHHLLSVIRTCAPHACACQLPLLAFTNRPRSPAEIPSPNCELTLSPCSPPVPSIASRFRSSQPSDSCRERSVSDHRRDHHQCAAIRVVKPSSQSSRVSSLVPGLAGYPFIFILWHAALSRAASSPVPASLSGKRQPATPPDLQYVSLPHLAKRVRIGTRKPAPVR